MVGTKQMLTTGFQKWLWIYKLSFDFQDKSVEENDKAAFQLQGPRFSPKSEQSKA